MGGIFFDGSKEYALCETEHVYHLVVDKAKPKVEVLKPHRRTLAPAASAIRAAKNRQNVANRAARGEWSKEHKPGERVPVSNHGRRALSPRAGHRA